VTFTVGCIGTAPLSYRWYSNNVPLTPASASLTLTNVQAGAAGSYYVAVTNFSGAVTSSVVNLTITSGGDGMPPLRIESCLRLGTNFIFSFTAISNHDYTVQFQPALASGTWQRLQDILAAPSNRLCWLTNAVTAGTNQFYRVATPRQP
jgi:hypothetical protein